ncbi:MAG: hypothetical protein ACRDT0_06140 [Pseudonocardiaceae bacterium]
MRAMGFRHYAASFDNGTASNCQLANDQRTETHDNVVFQGGGRLSGTDSDSREPVQGRSKHCNAIADLGVVADNSSDYAVFAYLDVRVDPCSVTHETAAQDP